LSLVSVVSVMILKSKGISNFNVNKRIDLPVTTFDFDLLSKYNPPEIMPGRKVQYALKNLYGGTGDILFNGRIEKIDDTFDVNRRIFNVSGRNVALYLEEQPFYAPCYKVTTGVNRTRNFQWLINRIVKGTGVKLGPEIQSYNQNFTNDPMDNNCFCGLFKKRTDAIDWLLTKYGELDNKVPNWFHWWVDTGGYLRVLDTTNTANIPTLNINQFPSTNILQIKVGVNIATIENDITVLGGENNTIRVRVYDNASIQQFGRRVADTITDTSLTTQAEVEARANAELKKRTQIVSVGEIIMSGFPQTECGLAVRLLFSERYLTEKFIFTTIKHSGKPGNYQTAIGISTDRNVLVNPNLTDIMDQMIKNRAAQLEAAEGTVTAVDTTTGTVSVVPVSSLSSGIASFQNAAMAGGSALKVKYFQSGG